MMIPSFLLVPANSSSFLGYIHCKLDVYPQTARNLACLAEVNCPLPNGPNNLFAPLSLKIEPHLLHVRKVSDCVPGGPHAVSLNDGMKTPTMQHAKMALVSQWLRFHTTIPSAPPPPLEMIAVATGNPLATCQTGYTVWSSCCKSLDRSQK